MKEVFLSTKEVLNENEVQDAKYVPYYYGMYSFVVANTLNNLEFAGYIERRGKKNSKLEQFRITAKGKRYISEIYNSLPKELQKEFEEKRKGWDQLGYDGILRLVYQKYPKYKEKSRIKKRYKPIDWGRGIG
jgi:predicted transcriptional regulator